MHDITTLVHEFEQMGQALKAILNQFAPDEEIYPSWTRKEVLAHFAGWYDAAAAALDALLNGRQPEVVAPLGPDYYNARTVEERADLPYEHVVREWQMNRGQFLEQVRRLPESLLTQQTVFPWGETGTVYDLIAGQLHHERYHYDEFVERLSSRSRA
ncbi:maleylpyruvate isomerase N-terminal domain-containing protein [Ardenticatena maritima]|nr:maleylpyruvate isomerase N-terminal domain-containing protein [Ardenticatena maritima]KPL87180.1 hypothetical protein SE16_11650 [Ardenticatena maritima]